MQRTVERVIEGLARWPLCASALAYAAVAVVAGRLVLAHPASTIVHDVGDPLLTAALLHWNAWTLPLTHAWWQLPIFAPTPDVLAFSEHLLGLSVVAAPVEWLVRDPLVAANLVTLLTYPLCGVAMFLVVRRLTGSATAAFLAGLAYAFSPYRAAQQPHLQMLATFWAPLALLGLHGYVDSGRRAWLVLFGAAWLLQALANLYSLYFLSVLVALWTLWFVILPGRWSQLRDITVATLIAAVPLAPTIGTYVTVHARHGFTRSAVEAQAFSADLTSLLCAAPETAIWSWLQVGCRPEAALFPGLVLMVLVGIAIAALRREGATEPASTRALRLLRACVGLAAAVGAAGVLSVVVFGPWRLSVAGLRLSASEVDKPLLILALAGLAAIVLSRTAIAAARQRTVAGFYLGAAFVMWLLALGPTVVFMGVARAVPGPFRLLLLLPGGGVRAPARFWLMSTLCLSIVAGLTASRLLAGRRPRAALVLTALLSIGLLSDGWATIPAAPAPGPLPEEAAMRGHLVLTLPIGNFQDFGPQYRAVVGGWRSVNGYSGYEPKYYEALRQGARFEVDGLFEPFRAREDLFVLVHVGQPRLTALVERQAGAVLTAEWQGIRQYHLPRQSKEAPPHSNAAAVHIANASASCPSAAAAVDGDPATRWACGEQRGIEWFLADLGAPVTGVSAVRYVMGESYREFPRRLVVETSIDAVTWDPAWDGDVIGPTIEGSLQNPLTAPATLPFTPRRARYVRLRQTGKDTVGWALPELSILAGG
ncbi:MAG TPA: discoidin domain-containing protein [Vicinamibacterales bacterium]|nr:discoidin domain-containing protein [Vicinamibacterales bacterium]